LLPDDLVLFLDENLHNCSAILDSLAQLNVRCERHGQYFKAGAADSEWLPLVGRQGWLLITLDQSIRYNELERRAIERWGVRAFIFTSGNLSGKDMAVLLVKALPVIRKLCKRQPAPFIATITKTGAVHLRFPRA
jgi:hypothetical protein